MSSSITEPSSLSLIDYIYESFIKGGAIQKGSSPGFCHALKLSYHTIDKSQFSVGPNSLTYRYQLSSEVPKFTLGLLMALMDELNTFACFRVGLPSPPGISLQMQTELVDHHLNLTTIREIHVISIVTKLGKTVSYLRTEFRSIDTNQLIACGSHVKYMPTGSRLNDVLFHNRTLYDLSARYHSLATTNVPHFDSKPLFQDVIQSHLEFRGLGNATFHMTREHTNTGNSLHGGCHAMIMEAVAQPLAQEQLSSDHVQLQAIHIQFLRPAKGSIDLVCEIMSGCTTTLQLRVFLKHGDRILSEGQLQFVPLPPLHSRHSVAGVACSSFSRPMAVCTDRHAS